MRLWGPPGDLGDTSETPQGIRGGESQACILSSTCRAPPSSAFYTEVEYTISLSERGLLPREKKEEREREGEKEACLASRSPTRAHERSLLEKRERTQGPLPPFRGKAWLSAHPNHQQFLKGPYKSGDQGGRDKETGEKATPSAELSVYGLSDAPPAVGVRPRETQEPSGKVRGEGDDNRKGGTSSRAWGGASGPNVPTGKGPWSAGRALWLLPPLRVERALCLGDSCL